MNIYSEILNANPIKTHWKDFDRFQRPLFLFHGFMSNVIMRTFPDKKPSVFSQIVSTVLSPVIYPLCGLVALMGVALRILGISTIDRKGLNRELNKATEEDNLSRIDAILKLGVHLNEDLIGGGLYRECSYYPIQLAVSKGKYELAKNLIERIDTSKPFALKIFNDAESIAQYIRNNSSEHTKQVADEIVDLLLKKVNKWARERSAMLYIQRSPSANVYL